MFVNTSSAAVAFHSVLCHQCMQSVGKNVGSDLQDLFQLHSRGKPVKIELCRIITPDGIQRFA